MVSEGTGLASALESRDGVGSGCKICLTTAGKTSGGRLAGLITLTSHYGGRAIRASICRGQATASGAVFVSRGNLRRTRLARKAATAREAARPGGTGQASSAAIWGRLSGTAFAAIWEAGKENLGMGEVARKAIASLIAIKGREAGTAIPATAGTTSSILGRSS